MELKKTDSSTSKINWLYILSPCVFAIVFSLFAVIYSFLEIDRTEGWSFLGVIIFLPVLLILAALDLLIKFLFKKEALQVWVVELVVVVIGVGLYFNFIAA